MSLAGGLCFRIRPRGMSLTTTSTLPGYRALSSTQDMHPPPPPPCFCVPERPPGNLFESAMGIHNGPGVLLTQGWSFAEWNDMIPKYTYSSIEPFHDILVPTVVSAACPQHPLLLPPLHTHSLSLSLSLSLCLSLSVCLSLSLSLSLCPSLSLSVSLCLSVCLSLSKMLCTQTLLHSATGS